MTAQLPSTPSDSVAARPGARIFFRGLFFLGVVLVGAAVLIPLGLRADFAFMNLFQH